jgi:CelD/BcsL family acetyltransferase involved in cellulose biosynthesis
MALSIELVTDVAAFEALGVDWNELVDAMEFPEAFYRWEWSDIFRRHFRSSDSLFVLLVRESAGAIVGLAPFCVRQARSFGITVKVMETIVGGLSDYSNIFVRQGTHRGRVVSTILDFLHKRRDAWDVIDLWDLCTRDATTLHVLNLAPPYPDWSVRTHVSTPVAVRDLTVPAPAANEKQLHQIRNRMKALKTRGLQLKIGCTDIDTYWPAFCDLHRKAWPSGPFHEPAKQAFYDELKSAAGLQGRMELSVAELEGRPVAIHFGFIDERKVYYYMPAMDRDFRADRIGSVLLQAMIEHYGKTHRVFDFMRGLEAYKLWYTDDLQLNLRLVIYRSASLRALAYNFAGVTRRYGVELGLPKAMSQIVKSWIGKVRR